MRNFFLRHLVRNHQHDAIAFRAGDEGEPKARVPRGRFNNCSTRLQFPLALSRFDHGQRHAILYRPCRILILELKKKLTLPGIELRDFDQWCVAD